MLEPQPGKVPTRLTVQRLLRPVNEACLLRPSEVGEDVLNLLHLCTTFSFEYCVPRYTEEWSKEARGKPRANSEDCKPHRADVLGARDKYVTDYGGAKFYGGAKASNGATTTTLPHGGSFFTERRKCNNKIYHLCFSETNTCSNPRKAMIPVFPPVRSSLQRNTP
jgi:hypothetical protein